MASALQNLSNYDEKSVPSGKGKKIGIAVAEWNRHITFSLLTGCVDTLKQFEVQEEDIEISIVPGTFELPYAAKQLYGQNMNAVICIGCVIKGETDHDIYINNSVANALQNLNIQYNIISFKCNLLLTLETPYGVILKQSSTSFLLKEDK